MTSASAVPPTGNVLPGRLADNVMHFARVLRDAGLPVGTDRILLAYEALRAGGIASRADFYSVLSACFLSRGEHRTLFDQAFHIFWKDPDLLGKIMQLLMPQMKQKADTALPPENRRLADAMFKGTAPTAPQPQDTQRLEIDAALSWTDREQLRKADFDTMSANEWAAAKRLLTRFERFFARRSTRRDRPAASGHRVDLRAMLRASARQGGEITGFTYRRRRTRPEPLVVIIDISGSMSRYSRMFLHFLHAITAGRDAANHRVHSFLFGTRLTHITRQLAARDPDVAVSAVVQSVDDWSGGTRITQALHEFNLRWARRVMYGNPTVLLVTDGLEHGDTEALEHEAERLSKSCRRLIWLNPLLRYEGFEPRAGGVRALLPHVDAFLPVHNLASLEDLATQLTTPARASASATGRGARPWN
jgi:uncharacterized protein with von Willebrand factor type A (vWA) domain